MKPSTTTVVIVALILAVATSVLLASEEGGHLMVRRDRIAPGYVKMGDFAEYEGGVICKVTHARDPYREACPPGTPDKRVFVGIRFAEHVRGTEFEQKFLDQFRKPELSKEE